MLNRFRWTLALTVLLVSMTWAADWPQWRGPNRDGKSADTGLMQEWPAEGPPLTWRVGDLGGGDSAPAVTQGKIIAMANRGEDEVVWALSEADGQELWVTRLAPVFSQRMPHSKQGPSSTPTVDGERLYVVGMGGNLVCLQVADGKILWQCHFQEDFAGPVPRWSFRESPLIDGDKVICTPGGPGAAIVALNKLTGETIWKSPIPGDPQAAYASAIAIEFAGQRQYVQLMSNTLVGIAADDGQYLWQYDAPANSHGINCSTPMFFDGLIFASSAYGAGAGLAKLSQESDGAVKAEEVWQTKEMESHHGCLILCDGALYGASGGNSGGAMVCLDANTGEVKWDRRKDGERRAKGSLAWADNRLYYRLEDGTVLLIEPNAEKYLERGRFTQPDRTDLPAWAHPVIANGKLYIRDQETLFCYDIKAS